MRIRIWAALGALAFAATANAALAVDAPPTPPPVTDNNAYPDWGYHVDESFKYPEGRKYGGISGLDMDRDGKTVWVFDRCESPDGGCATSKVDPVMQFDSKGTLLRHWGSGMFRYPHGIFVDQQDNIWTADGVAKSGDQGQVVRKWSKDGKLLLTMGEWGVPGDDAAHFNGVSDVLVAPNGNIFIADGHDAKTNDRVLIFDKNLKLIKIFGKEGTGPGEFNPPHGLAMDKEGRLYVADRSNSRIQIFDQNGTFLTEWRQFGRPSGLFITKDDILYCADSLSSEKANPGFKTGIRWGSVKDGKVVGFIPWAPYNTIEAVAVADDGTMYTGFTNEPGFRKWVKN